MAQIETINVEDITQRKPFKGLFQMAISTISDIEKSINEIGYDHSSPVIVWKRQTEVVCIDGHTRLYVLQMLKKKEVPVVFVNFETEDDAIEYAIHVQRDRRNITDADLMRQVELLDRVKDRGGDHKSDEFEKSKGPDEPIDSGRTATATARKAGTSATKVKKVRSIKKHAPPEIKEAVDSGEMTINKAYEETQKLRKQERGEKKHETSHTRTTQSNMERHFRLYIKELTAERNSKAWGPANKQIAESCIREINSIIG